MMNIATKLSLILIAAAVTLSATKVEAQISCGAVVTKDTVMTSDISCPAHDPAFTVHDAEGRPLQACDGRPLPLF